MHKPAYHTIQRDIFVLAQKDKSFGRITIIQGCVCACVLGGLGRAQLFSVRQNVLDPRV